MSKLKISASELKAVGKKVSSDGEEFSSLLKEIKNYNDSLQASWEGDDATKYTQKIQEQAKVMDKLAETIDNVGTYLVQVAQAAEATEEANADLIK